MERGAEEKKRSQVEGKIDGGKNNRSRAVVRAAVIASGSTQGRQMYLLMHRLIVTSPSKPLQYYKT